MTRQGYFFIALLVGLVIILGVENHSVRSDQEAMRQSYGTFLARKMNGRPMIEYIKPESLAVFRGPGGMIACAVTR